MRSGQAGGRGSIDDVGGWQLMAGVEIYETDVVTAPPRIGDDD
jgi:hypothetical protein